MLGTTVDQYQFVARIGSGGMGEVYRAVDLELQRDVAIKCVRAELSDLDEITKRFRTEARLLARLSHQNIASVHRFFSDADRLFLVMEFVDGTAIDTAVRSNALSATLGGYPRTVGLVREALRGLGYAHENGVVHRDIKPGNLLVDRRGVVKVLDFGIAHLMGSTRFTRIGGVVGTPAYMAPEQILGQPIDPRTDLYSLGIVLYELLSGQTPYKGDSEFELMRSHLERAPPPLRDLTQGSIPLTLQRAVERALAKQKDDRFQSAADFDAALVEALNSAAELPPTVMRTAQPATPGADAAAAIAASGTRSPTSTPMAELVKPVAQEIRQRLRPAQILIGALLAGTVIAAALALREPRPSVGESAAAASSAQTAAGSLATAPNPAAPPSQNAFRDIATAGALPSLPAVDDAAPSPSGTAAPRGAAPTTTTPIASTPSRRSIAPASEPSEPPRRPARTAPARSEAPLSAAVTSGPERGAGSSLPSPPIAEDGPKVTTIKVDYHERQRTGLFARDAGYNGAFSLRLPPGSPPNIPVEEIVEIRRGETLIKREIVDTEIRRAGTFRSKRRVQGMKELGPGSYEIELIFASGGRTLGSTKWRLVVAE